MHFIILNQNSDLVDAINCPKFRHQVVHFLHHLKKLHNLGYHVIDPEGNILSHEDLHHLLHKHSRHAEEVNDYDGRGFRWGSHGGGWGHGRDWDRGWSNHGSHGWGGHGWSW